MSIKSKVFAAAATLTLVGGVSTVGTLSASAATPQCGQHCIDIYNKKFGTADSPRFVETVYKGVAKVGRPTILHRASSSNPAEDFLPRAGKVSDFYKAGLVSSKVNRHYGNLRAAEIEYAPSGKASGLCVGLAATAYQNEGLTLQPCDLPGKTVWIVDTTDSPATAANGYFPLVNGSTKDFAHPFAMTYPSHARWGHAHSNEHRSSQIRVRRLMGDPTHVPDSQLWGTNLGVVK
ncbi:hypothetical protein OG762_46295 [Streptomyces sp. NBC_01136]|uniref:hypothetical protein n=1 Tax=unclassified Streptomyces TaxID=2593676 RepID=UPI0032535841|nr:hypothetical protein OG762_00330 [Streptomyces sp. NBC_01136]WST81192.1 hypothetical protein OG762_46295 [Streptomyces sp. NBC_01136]